MGYLGSKSTTILILQIGALPLYASLGGWSSHELAFCECPQGAVAM